MIVEQRSYTLKPGATPEYMRLYEAEGLAIQEPILGKLIGWYTTDFGPLNQSIHVWGYDTYTERESRHAALNADHHWKNFVPKIVPLILRSENKTLIPAPWSPS